MNTKWNLLLIFALLVMLVGMNTSPVKAEGVLTISPSTLKIAMQGMFYQEHLTASGGTAPYTLSVTGGTLPVPGLSIDGYGNISGYPTGAGDYTFDVNVTDFYNATGSITYTLTVSSALVLSPTSTTLPDCTVGVFYSQQFTGSGGTPPYTFQETTTLPGGLSFIGDTISGTPTTAGDYGVRVYLDDAQGFYVVTNYSLTCYHPVIIADPLTLPDGKQNQPYSAQIMAAGGAYPYTWMVTGALPDGITFIDTLLRGTPTVSGIFPFTVTATDTKGTSASRDYTLTIAPDPSGSLSVGDITILDGSNDQPAEPSLIDHQVLISADVTGADGGATCMVSFGEGEVSIGPVVNNVCEGSHRYQSTGTFIVTVTVTNSDRTYASKSVAHNVEYADVKIGLHSVMEANFSDKAEPSFVGQPVMAFGLIQESLSASSCTFDYGEGAGPEVGTLIVQGWPRGCFGPEHIYATPGTYTVTLTVTGINGSTDTVNIPHTVGTLLLDQLPTQTNGYPSDSMFCESGTCALAANFSVPEGEFVTVDLLQLWGVYAYDPSSPLDADNYTDSFTVVFHQDASGMPGTTMYTESSVSAVREYTGKTVSQQNPLDEYRVGLTLAAPQTFGPGTYWVEIYNTNTNADTATSILFAWEYGSPDTLGMGLNNIAWRDNYGTWKPSGGGGTLALRLINLSVTAPSFSISGTVFEYQNTNGAYDTGEPGLSGMMVTLDQDSDGLDNVTTLTAADGSYTFTGLQPGQLYSVGAMPQNGYKATLQPDLIWSLDADAVGMNIGLTNKPLFTWTPESPKEGGTATFTTVEGFHEPEWVITQPGVSCHSDIWGSEHPYGQDAELTFGASGVYQVCLFMWNSDQIPVIDGQLVTVANVAPVPLDYAASVFPEPSLAGSPIQFATAAFIDADQLASCTVDYGDGTGLQAGTILVGENSCDGPAHTYAASGTFHVTFTAYDPDGAYGSVTIDHVVTAPLISADLSLTKTDSKDPVKPGASLVYTLTVKNLGPNAAQTLTLADTLDRNTTYVSISALKGWTCKYANYAVTCTSTSLASGGTAVIKITVTVSKTAKVGKELVNNATVSSVTTDPVLTNNTVVQKTMVAK